MSCPLAAQVLASCLLTPPVICPLARDASAAIPAPDTLAGWGDAPAAAPAALGPLLARNCDDGTGSDAVWAPGGVSNNASRASGASPLSSSWLIVLAVGLIRYFSASSSHSSICSPP